MSIRLRVTLVFTVALAVAFALGSWLLVGQLQGQLIRATDNTLRAQLSRAGQYLRGGVSVPEDSQLIVQLISPANQVFKGSGDAGRSPVLSPAELRLARAGQLIVVDTTVDEDRYRVVAGRLSGHPGWVAITGESLSNVTRTVQVQTTGLVGGGVVFVLLGGLGAYWLARAALSPVERMRREVAALSERDTQGGVRVPKTRDELAALAGTMNDLLARLHGALARQRAFVADASHELRTPLAVLSAELELAGRPGRSRGELAAAAASAEAEVARLTRITNDLLVLASSDEGRLPVRLEPTDVAVLLDRSVAAAASRAHQVGADCAVNAPPGLVWPVDPDRIRQAVDNLIDNALRFAPRGSHVTVSARSTGDALMIEVADTGPGFPVDYLPHAFERFRRSDTGRTRAAGGTGLGLAIVAAIAAAHGGTATATNSPAGGAIMTIELPGGAMGR